MKYCRYKTKARSKWPNKAPIRFSLTWLVRILFKASPWDHHRDLKNKFSFKKRASLDRVKKPISRRISYTQAIIG